MRWWAYEGRWARGLAGAHGWADQDDVLLGCLTMEGSWASRVGWARGRRVRAGLLQLRAGMSGPVRGWLGNEKGRPVGLDEKGKKKMDFSFLA